MPGSRSRSVTCCEEQPSASAIILEAILRRARSVPGVQAASLSTITPLSGLIMLSPVEVRGFSASDVRDVNAAVNRVTPDFFEVFGTRIVAGRSFRETDERLAPGVAIVNTDFVRRYLPETEPLGQVVRLGTRDLEIVGVVESGKYRSLQEAPVRFVYVPLQQWLRQQPLRLAVRTDTPRRGSGRSCPDWRCWWRRWGSTRHSPTSSAAAGRRSAYAWRSARTAAPS
jgi:hypothetical protein